MNRQYLFLQDFDRAFLHQVDIISGQVRAKKDYYPKSEKEWETVSEGFVKRFTLGWPVTVVKSDGMCYVYVRKKREIIDRSLQVKEYSFLFFHIGYLCLKNIKNWYFDVRFLSFFSEILDPLYDSFDRENNSFPKSIEIWKESKS